LLASEGLTAEQLAEDIASGVSVIPINRNHAITPIGIRQKTCVQDQCNIGTSKTGSPIGEEMEKLALL